MAVKIEFETSNAAFAEGGYDQVAMILRDLAEKCEDSLAFKSGPIRDLNGNRIGRWEATIDADETSE